MPNIMPPADLLEQIEGIEHGLRQRRRLGTIGWIASIFFMAVQVAVPVFNSEWFAALRSYEWEKIIEQWPLLLPLIFGIFFVFLSIWTKFWLTESQAPFHYTYSIDDFKPVPKTPTEDKLSWLRHDLLERLSERIGRLSLLEDEQVRTNGIIENRESHIHISGYYVIRKKPRDERWIIEVTPWIRIGPSGRPETMAHSVKFPLNPPEIGQAQSTPMQTKETERKINESVSHSNSNNAESLDTQAQEAPPPVKPQDYEKLLERVYFSVATQIYKQLRRDVQRKIELLPTNHFRAVAYFHEAEDYAKSNTLDAYDEARELYGTALKLYDPRWRPLAKSHWRSPCSIPSIRPL